MPRYPLSDIYVITMDPLLHIMYIVVMVSSMIAYVALRSYGRTVYAVRVLVPDPAGNLGPLAVQSSTGAAT